MSSRTLAVATLLALAAVSGAAPAPDARIITYEDAIRIALEQNTTLRQAENAAALSDLDIRQARNQFLPNLNLSTQAAKSFGRSFSESVGGTIDTTANSMNLNVNSGVTLFDGFSNVASLRQARASGKANQLDVQRARETVVFTVASDYLALIQQQEQLGVQREALASQAALEEQIQSYVDAGARTIADLYQQQANVAGARLAVVQAERAAELAKVDLIDALQLDPRGAYEFSPPAAEAIAAAGERPALPSLMDEALARRADLNAEQTRVQAADQGVRVARGGFWPTLSLSAGYGTSYNSASPPSFNDQLDQRRGGSIGLNLTFPIFDRSGVRIDTRRAEIQADNARLALEAQRNAVGSQVRRAYLDFRSADEQLTAAEAQEKAAALALQATQDRYAAGAATLVEVTQARATQVQAASSVVSARYATLFQRTLLDYYVGRLEPVSPPAPPR